MPLSDKTARNAKGRVAPNKLFDGGGLYLLVRPDGARYWRMDYRHAGKRRTLALGDYPSVTLAAAREQRDAAKRSLASGIDPSAKRKQEKLQVKIGAGNTFRIVADEWVAKQEREGSGGSYAEQNTMAFRLCVFRYWRPPDCRNHRSRTSRCSSQG